MATDRERQNGFNFGTSGLKMFDTARRPTIAPGAHIEVRDAVWRVVRVDVTSSRRAAWRCIGVSEIVQGQEALFLEDLEPDVRVLDPRETRLERDTSSQHRAGRLFIESLLRDVPPTTPDLVIRHTAALDVMDFQLEPAWQALQRPRARILIADAVGLGKTLEAGILLAELIRRGKARRILVATTRAMLTQFQKEMWCRFSIPLVQLDSTGLQRIRATIPTHHNPFNHFDRVIISIDTLKENNAFRTHVRNARWDVIVIDEAHIIAVRGGSGSLRSRVAEDLADTCDHLILLSATPHDGRAHSFASLMDLLDPTAIADPDDYGPKDIQGLFVCRFKKDVAAQIGEAIRPAERELHNHDRPLDVDRLDALRTIAVDAVYSQVAAARSAFEATPRPKLEAERERLRALKTRRMAAVERRIAGRADRFATDERDRERRRAGKEFGGYETWVEEAMTPAREPFLQIVAVIATETP